MNENIIEEMDDIIDIEEMDNIINKFIDNYYGTSIGEHIRRWRENTFDTDSH